MARTAKSPTPDAMRVVVADDLGFMRIALRQIIETDGDMHVVGEARNGEEALALVQQLRPDVVTLDVEMPVMDGIEAARRIADEVLPKPIIIMVSSHTQAGAAATIKALRHGAADFVSKQSDLAPTDLGHIDSQLRTKIRLLAEHRVPGAKHSPIATTKAVPFGDDKTGIAKPMRPACAPAGPVDLVAIAVSTGGPSTLATLLRAIGKIAAPIVIAQHMPEFFTACLAESLTQDTGLVVREGANRMPLMPGEVTILQGARDTIVGPRFGGGFELRLTHSEGAIHPSGDLLFESVAMVGRRPVGVVLTGMGDDGTRGAGRLAHRNLPVLVQRPDTCVIGGMPSAAIEAGVASEALSLEEIAKRLRQWAAPDFPARRVGMAGR